MPSTSTTPSAAIERLRADFERDWREGRAPRLEVVLQQLPPAVRQQGLLALLPIEMQWRHRESRPVSGLELSRRFWGDRQTVAELAEAAEFGVTRWQTSPESSDSHWDAADGFWTELPFVPHSVNEMVTRLRRCAAFSDLPSESLAAIGSCLTERTYLPGEVLLALQRTLSFPPVRDGGVDQRGSRGREAVGSGSWCGTHGLGRCGAANTGACGLRESGVADGRLVTAAATRPPSWRRNALAAA